jgi:hypothetical protein
MNIVEMIIDEIENEGVDYYLFEENSSDCERKRLKELTLNFLSQSDYSGQEDLVEKIIGSVFEKHGKHSEGTLSTRIMNIYETTIHTPITTNRKHYVHLVNVFLLGILFYRKHDLLKNNIIIEMENTKGDHPSSGGSLKGEFLYRWRLSSILHDIGNGYSIHSNDIDTNRRYVNEFKTALSDRDSKYEDWEYFNVLHDGRRSLDLLDIADSDMNTPGHKRNRVSGLFFHLKDNGYIHNNDHDNPIHYDHGLISAIAFLKMMDHLYVSKGFADSTNNVSYRKEYFNTSLVQCAYAIALHNLDFYPLELLEGFFKNKGIYNINKCPFALLLKLSDTLQEWNKPRAEDGKENIDPSEVEVDFSDSKIIIKEFPEKDNLSKKLKFMENIDIVEISYD